MNYIKNNESIYGPNLTKEKFSTNAGAERVKHKRCSSLRCEVWFTLIAVF